MSPSRSSAYLAALSALQASGIPCSEHDAPQTLLLALQPLIIAAAASDPWAFDRARYDHLMALWEALNAEQEWNEG